MTDLAEFEFYDLISSYQKHRDPNPLADAVRNRPEILSQNKQVREFVADIVDGSQALPKPKGLIKRETLERNREIMAQIALYKGIGFPIYNKDGKVNCCDLVAENKPDHWDNWPTSSQNIHASIYKKKEQFQTLTMAANELNGLAIHLSNNRKKPKSWDDALEMMQHYENLSETDKDHYHSQAQAEIAMLSRWQYTLQKDGKKFVKKDWDKIRDKAVDLFLQQQSDLV